MLATQESELTLDKEQLRVLASDTRLEILKLLAKRNHNISELAAKLGYSKSTIYEHINRLAEAGLIEKVNSGFANKWVYYRLTRKGVQLFDKSRKIVVIIASFFVILAVSQLALLFLQSPYYLGLKAAAPKGAAQTVQEKAVGGEKEPEVPMEEKSAKPVTTPDERKTLQVGFLLYGSAACFTIAIILFAYYKANSSRIILKREL